MWIVVHLSCEWLVMDQTQNIVNKISSKDLLTCGNGKGIHEKLLLKSKSARLETQKVPRMLDRLQSFLPQIAQANETLRQQAEQAPDGCFDIESVEDAEKIIEMDVALVELEDSNSSEEEVESSTSSEEDSSEEEVTAETFKLPGQRKRTANIQVLGKEGE
ncbi:NOP protein chaperone 1 isoform X2 [Paramisgurnus dabryanus]|uniref:NOP protein chaperone 1 isoform X2 n=1 Tax=Paramisgurnus dabryanus TaxID=90735 RepID=UPI003CCFBAB7